MRIKPFSMISEGDKLRGFIVMPKEKKDKYPVVILSHGMCSNLLVTAPYAIPFVKAGYAVFLYDFTKSGSGISSGDSTKMSLKTEAKDIENMVHYVRGLSWVDTDHVILSGCSQGGITSALTAPKVEELIERIVLYYPAFCIPDDARTGRAMVTKVDLDNIPDTYWTLQVKLGPPYLLDSIGLEPWREIKDFKKPVFIVHGKEDPIVNIKYARKAAEVYENCILKEIHGDHGFIFIGLPRSIKETNKYIASYKDY